MQGIFQKEKIPCFILKSYFELRNISTFAKKQTS